LNQFSFWCLHFWPCPSMWSSTVSSGTYGELLLFFSFVWQIVAMVLHHTAGLKWQVTHKVWFLRRGWYSCFSRCLLVSRIHLPPFQFILIMHSLSGCIKIWYFIHRVFQKKLHKVYAPQFCNRTLQSCAVFSNKIQKENICTNTQCSMCLNTEIKYSLFCSWEVNYVKQN